MNIWIKLSIENGIYGIKKSTICVLIQLNKYRNFKEEIVDIFPNRLQDISIYCEKKH